MPDDKGFKPPSAAAMQGRMIAAASATQLQEPLPCPRCDSSNTKFCYYNNYSLSQPRHFCKSCKRYWTRGGTLRNVPVGGGCRKNKRGVKRVVPSAVTGTAASRPVCGGGKPSPIFSYGNPLEVDPARTSLGFSFPAPLIMGDGGVEFLRDFVVPSANSVVPGYDVALDFPPMTSLDGISPGVASSLLASTIFQEQNKFLTTSVLGFKEDRGIGSDLKPLYALENCQAKFDEGHLGVEVNWSMPRQGQIHQIEPSDLTRSLCWNTIANGSTASWLPEPGGSNVGSSVPSMI